MTFHSPMSLTRYSNWRLKLSSSGPNETLGVREGVAEGVPEGVALGVALILGVALGV